MITSIVLLCLVGGFPQWEAHSASIAYEPIKITVNEHFDGASHTAHSGEGTQPATSIIPNVLHQGANFFFNPHLISPDYITGRLESVIASLKEKNSPCTTTAPLTTDLYLSTEQPVFTKVPEITTEDETEEIETEESTQIPPQPIYENKTDDVLNLPDIPDAPELPPPEPLEIPAPLFIDEEPENAIKEPSNNPILEDEIIETFPSVSEIEIPMGPELPPNEQAFLKPITLEEEIIDTKPCIQEVIISNQIFIPKPQKLFGLVTSVSTAGEEKCYPCTKLITPQVKNKNLQELPLILSDVVKQITPKKSSKTIVLLPTFSELPLIPTPKLSLDIVLSKKSKQSAKLLYPTTRAHNIIAERIIPNIVLSESAPKYLKYLSVPAALRAPMK